MAEALTSVLVSALVLGSLYALLASGLSLIWSTLRVFNYAHGSLLVLGAYLIWTIADRAGLPVLVALLIAVPAMAVVGVLLEVVAVRPFVGRAGGDLQVMVSTLAVASIIGGALQLIWGSQNRQLPSITSRSFRVGDVSVGLSQVYGLVLALVLVGGLILVLGRTEWGATIRAVEQNREMATLVGVRPSTVYATVLAMASGLACAAGLIYGITSTITPTKGAAPLLTAFVVLVFGGSTTLTGTLVGAFAIGLLEAATTYWLGLQWSPVAVFLVLVAVMLLRPEGLVRGRKT